MKKSSTIKKWYADLETYKTKEEEGENTFAYASGWLNDKGTFKSSFSTTYALKNFLSDLSKQEGHVLVMFYNLSYDLQFILEELIKSYPDVEFEFEYTEERTYIRGYIKFKKCKVKFGCSYLWNKTYSLKKWGNALGDEKRKLEEVHKYNMNKDLSFETDEGEIKEFNYNNEREYLEQDVRLVQKVDEAITHQKKTLDKFIGYKLKEKHDKQHTFSPSCPRYSLEALEISMNIPINVIFRFNVPWEEHMKMVCGSVGGFTGGNKNKWIVQEENISYYDINSSYGYIMSQELPGFEILTKVRDESKYFKWYIVKGTYCKWKEKYSFLDNDPYGRSFAYLDGNTEFYTPDFYYHDVLDRACDHDLEIVDVRYQEKTSFHIKFMEGLCELRNKYKRKKKRLKEGTQEYRLADLEEKIIKNSIVSNYGKLIEKHHSIKYVINNQNKKMTKVIQEFKEAPCILTGLYIVMRGRWAVMTKIFDEFENGNEPLYHDTDSLIMIERNKTTLKQDAEQLGLWKKEMTGNEFRYFGKAKKYALMRVKDNRVEEIKHALAGVSVKEQVGKWSLEDIRTLYSAENNVLFIKGKRSTTRVGPTEKMVINESDVESNSIVGRRKIKANMVPISHFCIPPHDRLYTTEEWEKIKTNN